MFSTAREAFALISPQRRRRFGQVALLSTVVAGLEMAAALAIAVLLSLVLSPGETPEVPVLGSLEDTFPGATYEQLVLWTCGAFAVLFLVRACLFLFQQYAVARVAENTAIQLSDRIVDGYLSMPYEWHLQRNSAELVRNAWDHVQEVTNGVFRPLANVLAEGVLVIGLVAVLVVISPLATLMAGVVLGMVLWITLTYVQPRLKRLGRRRSTSVKTVLQELQQGFGGVRDLKILGREGEFSRAHLTARTEVARAQYIRAAYAYLPRTALELAFLGLLLLAVGYSVTQGNVESILGALGVFAYAGLRLQPSLQKLSTAVNSLRFAEAPVRDLREGLELLDESRSARLEEDSDLERLPIETEIRLDDLWYSYPNTDEFALRGIDLVLPRGASLGVVGATGGGKSTLLDVVCGLLEPTTGQLLVDRKPVADHVRAWQRSLGVVHQQHFLTDDTIRRNIALGVADDDIDEDLLVWSMGAAQLEKVVAELPDGLDTVLGEHGVRLSGGQRQRVTVARALYQQPHVLVFDEGTASLDGATERRLVESVSVIQGLTKIMVAHRLTTVADCDEIIVLDGGRIVARGTYTELLQTSEQFQELAAGTG